MEIQSMTASFGKLNQKTLTLHPGLNIIYAPNESGKSTWAAFIRTMLYGLSTKSRGTLADKNRFAPWDGVPMRGRMDLLSEGEAYTVVRDTQRAASPMGAFSCTYQNTATAVPGITGQNLGEALLGVPREVFERSAFIRQSGLAVDQDPELERRITSLISAGDEDVSFSEAYDRLKKQLNRRRHNKTGQIPLLESRVVTLEHDLAALRELSERARALEERLDAEQADQRSISAQLRQWEQADAFAAAQARGAAQQEAAHLQEEADAIYRALQHEQIPPSSFLEQYEGQLQALQSVQSRVETAWETARQQAQLAQQAERARQASPLYPQTPAQLHSAVGAPPRTPVSLFFVLCAVLCAAGAGALVWFFLPRPYWGLIAFAAVLGGMLLVNAAHRKKADKQLAAQAELKREEQSRELEDYAQLIRQAEDAAQDALRAQAAADSLSSSFAADAQSLLSQIRIFQPQVQDLDGAKAAVASAKERLAAAVNARERAKDACLRLEMMPPSPPQPPAEAPLISRQELERRRQETESTVLTLQRQLDTLTGQLRLLGNPSETESQLSDAKEQLAALQAEYDAIAVAMEALEGANLTLQSRFSPALGAKAAAIFSAITDGRYQKVLLSRDFSIAAETAADPAARDIQLLSQGAADQLYFAVRMAICDMVLPEEKAVPLILDDALTSFDDGRLGAALSCLQQEAARRQILLFTCQKREAALLGSAAHCITC